MCSEWETPSTRAPHSTIKIHIILIFSKNYLHKQKKVVSLQRKRQQTIIVDESIFTAVMMRLHNTNLQAEIEVFVASQEAGVPQGGLQDVPQDITALIKQNPKITREELAASLPNSISAIILAYVRKK